MRCLLYSILIFSLISCTCKKYDKPQHKIQKTEKKSQEIKTSASKKVKNETRVPRSTRLKDHVQVTPLITRWHHQIDGEKIANLYLRDEILVAVTESSYLYAFDRKTGEPLWVYKVGHKLDYAPTKYKDKLFVLSMGHLHVISTITGGQLLKRELTFVPCSSVCATDRYVFIAGWDRFVYAVNPDTARHDWRFRLDDHVWSTPVEVEGSLYFATMDNRVYSISSQTGDRIKEWGEDSIFHTFGSNKAHLTATDDPPVLFVASRDYNLYAINRITGIVNWKFESGGEINKQPLNIGNAVYCISQREAGKSSIMHALDVESGNLKWEIANGRSIYFQGKYHVWIMKYGKNLIGVNPKTGKTTKEFSLGMFSHFTSNTNDDLGFVGYMATDDGYIFAVEEK